MHLGWWLEEPRYKDVVNAKAAVAKIEFSDGTVTWISESNLHWFSGESGYAAMPSPAVNIVPLTAEELEMNGSFSMGLKFWELYPEYTQRYGRKTAGWWISSVAPGSISKMGGIQVGDKIISIDGVRYVDDPLVFDRAKARIGNGEESIFLVGRSGEEIALTLTKLTVFAETTKLKTFDYTVLESYPGYIFNKSDTGWSYTAEYSKELWDNLEVKILFVIGGDNTISKGIEVGVEIDSSHLPTEFIVSVDDKRYFYSNLPESDDAGMVYIRLGDVGHQMIEDIAKAESIDVTITYKDGAIATVPTLEEFSKIITMCKNLVEHDVWDYMDDTELRKYDLFFNATVE